MGPTFPARGSHGRAGCTSDLTGGPCQGGNLTKADWMARDVASCGHGEKGLAAWHLERKDRAVGSQSRLRDGCLGWGAVPVSRDACFPGHQHW